MCYRSVKLGDKAQKFAPCDCTFCKVTQDTRASVAPFVFKVMEDECLSNEKTGSWKKRRGGGRTSNKIKDINRTKYAPEISSEIKDVSIITMSKTCRAHQHGMVCAPGEFCRNNPFCGESRAPQ